MIKSYNAASGTSIPDVQPTDSDQGKEGALPQSGGQNADMETVNAVLAQIAGGIEQALNGLSDQVVEALNTVNPANEEATPTANTISIALLSEPPPPPLSPPPPPKNMTIRNRATSGGELTVTLNEIAGDGVINAAEAQLQVEVSGTVDGAQEGDQITLVVNENPYSGFVLANGAFSIFVAGADLVADPTIEVLVSSGGTVLEAEVAY